MQKHRELVAAQVERAHRDHLFGKRLGDTLIGQVLVFFTRHLIPADHQKLRTKQPDALRAMEPRPLCFPRQIQIRAEFHGLLVGGDRRELGDALQLIFPGEKLGFPFSENAAIVIVGIQDHTTDPTVHDGFLPRPGFL